ncbi:MAG: preprotein translocase subunit SecG [Candidatus Omnitrophota bacterium]
MNILVVCIHVVVCIVLIVVILLQAGRGQGLTGASFGGNVQSLFGTKASSFLTKATTVCAILFLFTCIGLNILEVQKSRSLFKTPQSQAPLDVEQIKKTLEKMKQADKTGATATSQTSIPSKGEAVKLAEAAKADVVKVAETAKTDAVKISETVKNEVVTTAADVAKKI